MSKRVNLIPMAGSGQRFVDEGYFNPKPVIDVDGLPMAVRAAKSLPSADLWIFICREEHIWQYGIDSTLKEYFQNAKIIVLDHLTEGQAITCLAARNDIYDDDMLTIAACDNAVVYNKDVLHRYYKDETVEAFIWTFRNNQSVLQNPNMYGWVEIDENDSALSVSCKKSISGNPLNDHAILGSFTFKRASDFFSSVDLMIERNIRINNEFYIDVAMNMAIENGVNVKIFEVAKYICWGTPKDLRTYLYWREYFKESGLCYEV